MTTFSCTNITRRYKNFCLDNVSFSMETGYFYVLAGVNGSGKTTLLNCITGVDSSFLHGILWNAQIGDVSLKASPEAYRRKLGYISERCPFFMEESVAQNGLTYGEFYPDWSVRDYSSYLSRLDVDPSKRVYQLSKGEFMKMQTCFALAHHPDSSSSMNRWRDLILYSAVSFSICSANCLTVIWASCSPHTLRKTWTGWRTIF